MLNTTDKLDKKQVPFTLTSKELALFERIVTRQTPCREGEVFCQAGEALNALYLVLSGSFTGHQSATDNQQPPHSQYQSGDIIGLNSIGRGHHRESIIAREVAEVAELPLDQLEALSARMPALRKEFIRLLSDKIHTR